VSKSAYHYPPDEFDAPPDPDSPRGVHRAPQSAWSRWWPFLAVIVIVPLVAWGAVTMLANRGELPNANPTDSASAQVTTPVLASTPTSTGAPPTPTAPAITPTSQPTTPAKPTTPAPSVDLTTPVTVLNGAGVNGLAATIKTNLVAAGFGASSVTATNPTTAQRAWSNVNVVYYGSASQQATAQLIGRTINVTNVVQSSSHIVGSSITVLLRSTPSAGG